MSLEALEKRVEDLEFERLAVDEVRKYYVLAFKGVDAQFEGIRVELKGLRETQAAMMEQQAKMLVAIKDIQNTIKKG